MEVAQPASLYSVRVAALAALFRIVTITELVFAGEAGVKETNEGAVVCARTLAERPASKAKNEIRTRNLGRGLPTNFKRLFIEANLTFLNSLFSKEIAP